MRKCRKLNWLLRVTDCSYEQQLKDILFNTSHSSALVAYYYLNLWRHLVGRSIEVCPPLFDFYVAEEVTNISFLSFYYKLKIIDSFNSGNIILARSLFGKALNSGVVDAETLLIYSSVHESSSVRLSWINIALARYGLPSVSLDNRCSSSDYGLLDNFYVA